MAVMRRAEGEEEDEDHEEDEGCHGDDGHKS